MHTTITGKKWRKLKPQTMKVIELVKPYTNTQGKVDYERLDVEQKNWLNQFPSRKFVIAAVSRLEASGRLLHAINGGATNGHADKAGLGPVVRMPDGDELEGMVQARVAALLGECGHCPKCGRNLTALFHAVIFESQPHA